MSKKFLGGLVAASALFLAACGGGNDTAAEAGGDEPVQVKVGVVGEVNEPWEYTIEQLKEKENIEVELVKFTEYSTPNRALADGELDLNAFQTEIFMDEFNESTGEDLTTIGYTVMAPLSLFSNEVTAVEDIAEGSEIAIPNDASNSGRALRLLQSAGLIKVDPAAGLIPTVEDITDNPLNLKITELDSSQTARALDDVTASVINSGMAVDAGLIPAEDAIYREPVTEDSKPYYNVIASRPEDVDNEVYKTIVEYYQSEGTAKVIDESSRGSNIPVWDQIEE